MIQQTIFPFKIETTKERLTAHGGLALMAEFNHSGDFGGDNPIFLFKRRKINPMIETSPFECVVDLAGSVGGDDHQGPTFG